MNASLSKNLAPEMVAAPAMSVRDLVHAPARSASTVRWMRLALVYFVAAVSLGVAMAATHDFRLKGLHVHLNMLGWVSMSLKSVFYERVREAAASRWASVHFWLYTLALPVMMVGLAGLLLGHAAMEPVVAIGSVGVLAAVIVFVANLMWHLRRSA
jgi:hypothetical protein